MTPTSRRTWASTTCPLCLALGCPYCQGTGRVLQPVEDPGSARIEHVRVSDTYIHARRIQ